MKDSVAVFLGALVTVAGWFITYSLAKRREDRTRREELTIKYLQRQIEEFYGPLFNLVNQIFVANHVKYGLLENAKSRKHLTAQQVEDAHTFFWDRYFRPLHDEIRGILKSKLFLVEGADMPESFYEYLRHSTQEAVQRELWQTKQLDTSFIRGVPWPDTFEMDIKTGLDSVMQQYEKALQGFAGADGGGKSRGPERARS